MFTLVTYNLSTWFDSVQLSNSTLSFSFLSADGDIKDYSHNQLHIYFLNCVPYWKYFFSNFDLIITLLFAVGKNTTKFV